MTEFGRQLPEIVAPPPGPGSREMSRRLARVESRNVTYRGPDFPVFWESAQGANVRDVDGNVYVDLTAAFGVSILGHAAPVVREAVGRQAEELVHGMGDVHPPAVKVEFLERLVGTVEGALGSWGAGRAVLASSGSEAVEIALKTAALATGRSGVVAFRGGYHGLTLGALSVTARPYFREPFGERLPGQVAWLDFPTESDELLEVLTQLEDLLRDGIPVGSRAVGAVESGGATAGESGADRRVPVGAVILEPVQARGGVGIPADGFGACLSRLAHHYGALVVADEIYTGFGRCGSVLASTRVGLDPDLVCVGKILGGGLPMSACLGTEAAMNAWPESPGEALHTSTFLGHPLGCAAGIAVLEQLDGGLPEEAELLGERLRRGLEERLDGVPGVRDIRGMGLLLGVELAPGQAVTVAELVLKEGLILLPAGDHGEVVELSPPLTLTARQEGAALEILARVIRQVVEA